MNLRAGIVTGCLALTINVACFGQLVKSGPQVTTFFSLIDDTDQPYGLYMPKNFNPGFYDPSRKYPLVISLHGAYSNHRLNLKRVFGLGNRMGETDAEATRYFPEFRDVGMIVASPLARGTLGYVGIPEADVYAVLDDVKKRFPIDEDRIYLTGLSMGGGGTLYIGLTRPDIWAAIAPVCPAPPVGTMDLAPNALNIPVKLFHGDADPIVPVTGTREWNKRFLELGVKSEYVEYPGVKHNSWDNAYANASIFDWFAQFKRNTDPQHVRFISGSFEYADAYWVHFDSLTPGTLASIDAEITGASQLKITTSDLDGFTLKLHTRRPWKITIDGQKFSTKVLSFTKNKTWREGKAPLPSKRTGSIYDAIGKKHIYVYGTADQPSEEEVAHRREVAERLADWATPRTPLLLTLRSFADKNVKPTDSNGANLILLGTRETNSLIPDAPIRLRPDAADYTLITVAPDPTRQVVIISGKSPGSLAPRPFQVNMTYDYILMRGREVLASGNFDKNWRLTDEQRKRLADTGVVEIRN